MKKTTLIALFTAAILLIGASYASWGQATLPDYDPMNYTVGTGLQTQTGWTTLNTGDNLLITAGNLSYTGLTTSTGNKLTFDGAGIDAAKLFTQQTTGTVYFSFLLNVSALGTMNTTGGYFAGFTEGTTTTFGATVWARKDAGGVGYNIGINPRTTAANTVWYSGVQAVGTTYLVVIAYQMVTGTTNDVVKMWINPTPGAIEPAATVSATNALTDLVNVNRLLIRQDASTTTPFVEMDEFRTSTAWADVTPAGSVVAPTVTTQTPTSIGTTTATGNGNITATGGENPGTRGFCWDLSANPDPTVASSHTSETGSFGTGAFTGSITGLTVNTSYKVRAYATNSAGTSYGDPVTITTSANPSVSVSTNSLTGFTYYLGAGPSAEQTFTVSGTNLTAPIDITAATDYEVSLTTGTGFSTPISLSPSSGTVSTTTIFVRLKAGLAAGTYSTSENIVASSTTASQSIACSGSVTVPIPTITVGTVAAFGNQTINTTSTEKTYTVTGTNLSDPIIVTPPAGFEVSTTTGTGFVGSTGSLTLTPASGSVSATIYVRFAPTAIQSYSGVITHTSTGATQQDVTVSGAGIAALPALPWSENFSYTGGTDLNTQNSWSLIGSSNTQKLYVANSGLTFPGYSASGTGNAATILGIAGEDLGHGYTAQNSGALYYSFMVNVANTTSAGTYFTALNTTATATNYTGRIYAKVTSGSLYFGVSKSSEAATYTTTAYTPGTTYLIVLKYEFVSGTSNDKVSLYVFPTSLPSTEPATADIGPLTPTNTDNTSLAGVMMRQDAGLATTVTLDGMIIATSWTDIASAISAPTTQASNIVFSNITSNQMDVAWTNGNGSRRVVIANTTNSFTTPADGTDPTATAAYAGSGEQVVYNGTGNSVTVTGLASSTTYYYKVYEYNGAGAGNTVYCTATGANNPNSQATAVGATAPIVGSPTATSVSYASAVLGGTITDDGGAAITERGTVWSTTAGVTIADNKLAEGGTTTGVFSHSRTGLPGGTTIYYKAYATNSVGTTLTSEASFVTLVPEPTNHVTSFTAVAPDVSSVTLTWNDNNGTQPATGFLILASSTNSGVFTPPVDGVPQSNNTTIGTGTGVYNVAPGVQTYTWSGLSASTTYYFVIYPYTNSGATIDYKTAPSAPQTTATTQSVALPLAAWVFDGLAAAPSTPNTVAAEYGFQSGTAMLYADGTNGSSSWITATLGNELTAFAGSTTNDPRPSPSAGMAYCPVGGTSQSANGKSMVMHFSMTGFQDPILTYATRNTSTGFSTQAWEYSTDGSTFTSITSITGLTTSFATKTIDMSSINALDGASDVYLRITYTGATNSTGNNRVDNIVINASALAAPSTQTSGIGFLDVTATTLTAYWIVGNGSSRIVKMNTSNSFTDPVDGQAYTASSAYTGSGEQVVYNGSGDFQAITGLTANTTYWFRAYEYYGAGTATKYQTATATDNPNSVVTSSSAIAPIIINGTAINIGTTTALLGGNITSDGGAAITERGTVWKTSAGVTISDNKLAEGGTSTGVFSHSRTSLPSGTTIYYAAYATNSAGTSLTPEQSFTTYQVEPQNHVASMAATAPTYSTVTLTWSDNDGTPPASGFLVVANITGTFTAPVDGVTQTDDLNLADGSSVINVAHGVQTYTWTGLSALTPYYFTIYPYTNTGTHIDYKTSPTAPTTTVTTPAQVASTYTWQGADNASWTVATNWNPTRTTPATDDILHFSNGVTDTITDVPTQTIGQILVSNNTSVNLKSADSVILTIGGLAGVDLDVQAGCALNLKGNHPINITLSSTATGSISGSMAFGGYGATPPLLPASSHRLRASAGAVTFNSGSTFTAGLGITGNPFGTTPLNAITFASGSVYIAIAGSNPFGGSGANSVVVWSPGSLFKFMGLTGSPSLSGRTYADIEFNVPHTNRSTIAMTGSSAFNCNNFTVSGGFVGMNLTGGINIKGNITVESGDTLTFAGAGLTTLNGTTAQTISGDGVITNGTTSTLVINNSAGVNISASPTLNGNLTLTSGLVTLGSGNLTLGATSVINGTPSSTKMIVPTGTGKLYRTFSGVGTAFTFPVGDNTGTAEYSPVTLTPTAGTFTGSYIVGVNLKNIPYGGIASGNYLSRYWDLSSTGITDGVYNSTFTYLPADIHGDIASIYCVLISPPTNFAVANNTNQTLTATAATSLGVFTGKDAFLSTKTLNLKLFLEGIYNTGTGLMNEALGLSGPEFGAGIADTVDVELHNSVLPYDLAYQYGNVNLHTDGTLSITSISGGLSGDYYVVIKHGKSIETWSATPVTFTGSGPISFDFTTAAEQAFGSNQKLMGSVYAFFAGDVTQDGVVDGSDMANVDNSSTAILLGYSSEDVNGDGVVDGSDMAIVDNNATAIIQAIRPY